jgi:uncharacterized membrane protein
MTPLIAARALALVSTGLIAGIFLGHRAGVSRASTQLAPGSFIQLQQIIHQVFQRMMPPLVVAAVLSTLTWTVLFRADRPVIAFWLLVSASLGLLVAAILTRAINIPINRQLMTWDTTAPPREFSEIWGRWERIHSIRTLLAVIALVCQTLALAVFSQGAP